ncbi:hypothetical protein APHAL10511_001262 [Amanita phalloides]|nr:hypothetical protein APHAL10511_001262 [Amanita phalloides]
MSPIWDASSVKGQLKLTSQRLRQLQDRKDAQGRLIRKDIAILLRKRTIWLARLKAQSLLIEEASADLLERLEMYIGVLLEHFGELDMKSSLSPVLAEAVATIVHVAPHIECEDLQVTRNLFVGHIGVHSSSPATTRNDSRISPAAARALAAPSASEINACLRNIALSSNVSWEPEPLRQDIAYPLLEVLNEPSSFINIPALRKSCCHGIPDEPPWLRPRIWRLLLGLVPRTELRKRRDDYYDLVRQLLSPFTAPQATTALAPLDATLLDISKQLFRIPSVLFLHLDKDPGISNTCPLDAEAPDNIRIPCANNLELRLAALHNEQKKSSMMAPAIPVGIHNPSDDTWFNNNSRGALVANQISEAFSLPHVHHKNSSALLRILYIHATINPGALSPHVPSLLIPLYTAFTQEVEPEHADHTEADAFWLFETMLGEFSEFEDEQSIHMWMCKFGERVAWADEDLYNFLLVQGLDPALPHYSYRWFATLLSHTLPLSSVLVAWDVLFSCPMRSRSTNHKMDHLLDICAGMLLCLRSTLFSLRGNAAASRLLLTPHGAQSQSNDVFMEGMSLLQNYPIEAAGGIDRILQTASDLLLRRLGNSPSVEMKKYGLGVRIRDTMWKGFTNQLPSPTTSPTSSNDDSDPEKGNLSSGSSLPSFTSRLATTVWKGVTNQTAMEVHPSPPASPLTPITESPIESEETANNGTQQITNAYNGLWSYAEKLKDSDAVAAVSKVSSNWKARALTATWGRTPSHQKARGEHQEWDTAGYDAGPTESRSTYSPPPRPTHFHSPRDSYASTDVHKSPLSQPFVSLSSDLGILNKTKASLATLISPPPKSAPKPLLLNSSSLMTPTYHNTVPRHPHSAPASGGRDWVDHPKVRSATLHRGSLSSISSLEATNSRESFSDKDTDTSGPSRRILLNRKSVSPLAPKHRLQRSTYSSDASSVVSLDLAYGTPTNSRVMLEGVNAQNCASASPMVTPPQVPRIPASRETLNNGMHVSEPEQQRDSEGPEGQVPVVILQSRKSVRNKATAENSLHGYTTDSSSVKLPTRSVRVRVRRHQAQSADLQAEMLTPDKNINERTQSPNALKVEWPGEEQDASTTPRASEFDLIRQQSTSPRFSRKLSGDGREARVRKVSGSQRSRKISSESREAAKNSGDSAAEEGDDEGYDDLLSAYKSEDTIP